MTNLWETPEAEAWCRGFMYDDYVVLYTKMNGSLDHILTHSEYHAIRKFFSKVQMRDCDD